MSDYTESDDDDLAVGKYADPGQPPCFDAASLLHEIREDVHRLLAERPGDDELRHRVELTYREVRKHLRDVGANDLANALGDPFAAEQPFIRAAQPWQVAASCR